ncbi:uncharacterized protein PHACADRAFT_254232 [Phanerochaete carnosa HHB-10118-sp]|uniref:Uncharacterized protein n=1 Tax=Phanerochaete carnosa (strain HHB-10118-sp) TaxID=650164 RepID=K5X278_PHACS|nr:uncharacterized protein PHACADRAFT_254232 [Phanerochaete carnosa HHB-10118-sp]EKM56872.1 hypothetical protein PHACADRAFT_254232 [Phanerochaete carnosa HHB-10118-sp]
MSSTYVHYSTPSSLPSDYALLSRFAAARGISEGPEQANDPQPHTADETAINEDNEDVLPSSSLLPQKRPRRSSFPTAYVTPFNPTSMGPLPDKSGYRSGPMLEPTENTPLLAPPVPRIPEEVDGENLSPESGARPNVIWEEMCILTKYTLPVFG